MAVRTKLLAVPVAEADRIHRVATLEGVAGVKSMLESVVRGVLTELASGKGDGEDGT